MNLLFFYDNNKSELFGGEEETEGLDVLFSFMLGMNVEDLKGVFGTDPMIRKLLQRLCYKSLWYQLRGTFNQKCLHKTFINAKRRARYSVDEEELESHWLREQAERYGEMHEVLSIGYLYIPLSMPGSRQKKIAKSAIHRTVNTN
ncbi:MAG TPA: hypothetical protein VN420_02325 [Candidatus Fimivivens sp.]|nr:hypothetical protein [Candidatus Fimivivens sp.]